MRGSEGDVVALRKKVEESEERERAAEEKVKEKSKEVERLTE